MQGMIKGLLGVVLGIAALISTGCGSSPGRYNIVISPEPALQAEATPPTIAVDLVAVAGEDAANWRAMPMSKYWVSDGQMRKGKMEVIKQFTFGPGAMKPQTLSKDDKIWDSWKSADTLFVLARLPVGEDQTGDLDPRRVIFPLMRDRWDDDTLKVSLFRNHLTRESQPKPEKK